jgi:serine/threonine protein kinase
MKAGRAGFMALGIYRGYLRGVQETLKEGRYVIMRPLGEGSQGATLEAVDKLVGRLVAIKKFEVKTAKKWKDVELAEREARVLASLSHPSLPAYVEHFEENGSLYLVMERIEGVSLTEFRKKGAVFKAEDVTRLLEQAAVVLAYLHSRTPPIIHRDLKPSNVVRRPDGGFAFVDFGAVRDRLRPAGGSTVVGTFGYMAPEQFQGRAQPASDVYAVGATALWMLTGEEPEDLPHKGLGIDVPTALGRRASPELVTILSAMLEPDPEKRAKSITPLLVGLETPKPRAPPPERRPAPSRRPRPTPPPAPDEDFPIKVVRFFTRMMPLLWVLSAFSWWWLPFRSALGITMGLVVLGMVTRSYRQRYKASFKRYPRVPAVRVADSEEARVRVDPSGEEAEEDDADERAHRRRR